MIPFIAAIVAALIGIAGYFLYTDSKSSAGSAAGTVAPAPSTKKEAASAGGTGTGQPTASSAIGGPQQEATAASKAPNQPRSQGILIPP